MKTTSDGFVEVAITSQMIDLATEKASEMGILRNSIRQGKGNLAGFLGEHATTIALNGATSKNTYQHDIVYEDITFEVKTKDRTVPPKISYEASVANYNPHQVADFYIFVSLLRNKSTNIYEKAYVIGLIEKAEYFKKATFLRVGDIDPSNGWKVSADCYNLPYRVLTRFN